MGRIYENILETIGNTPLVKLHTVTKGVEPTIACLLEYFNPGGSVKDRLGLKLIEDAEEKGYIKPGGTIIEGTSGNTGMGLALAAAIKGYSCIFVMPDKMSQEKIDALKAFGAEVIVTPTAVEPDDPRSYYSVSARLEEEIPNSYYPNQYDNPANPATHYETTGPHIWELTEGRITAFVAGMGTGGTLSGAGRFLKEKNPDIQIIGIDPMGSMYYDKFHHDKIVEAQTYKVEGIGEDFFPTTMNLDILDDVVRVYDKESFLMTRELAHKEGIFTGGSGGSAVVGALRVAERFGPDDLLVVLLPDTGARYLSKVHSEAWMRENRYLATRIEQTAQNIVKRKTADHPDSLITVGPESLCFEALRLMKEYDISQIPVFDSNGEPLGGIKEDRVISVFLEDENAKHLRVSELLDEPFPIVDGNASLEEISRLLTKENPAVLVRQEGGWNIITKADLIACIAAP